jgi:hypothetical protein
MLFVAKMYPHGEPCEITPRKENNVLKTLLTGAVLGSAMFLSPLASSAEPTPPSEPTAEHEHMDHHGPMAGPNICELKCKKMQTIPKQRRNCPQLFGDLWKKPRNNWGSIRSHDCPAILGGAALSA